jgi:hypothetical protein
MLIATEKKVYRWDPGEPAVAFEAVGIRRVEEGHTCEAVALEDGTIVLLRDGAETRLASGIEGTVHSLLILSEEPLRLLIGAEPPYLYILSDSGPAARNESFATLDCRGEWHTPWGGPAAVRSMAATPDGWVYADIHVGSIMRSADRGETWEPVTPTLHADVHQVNACPAAPDRVYAETADAFWLSEDRGKSWHHRAADLGERYGRAVAVHPSDPELVLATVSDGPHGDNVHGRLYRSADAGLHWEHVADGFPASTPDNIDTFHVAFDEAGQAYAVVGNVLYSAGPEAAEWSPAWEAPSDIIMLSARRP